MDWSLSALSNKHGQTLRRWKWGREFLINSRYGGQGGFSDVRSGVPRFGSKQSFQQQALEAQHPCHGC